MGNSPSEPIDDYLNQTIPLSVSCGGKNYESLKEELENPQEPAESSTDCLLTHSEKINCSVSTSSTSASSLCFVFFSAEEAEKFRKKIISCPADKNPVDKNPIARTELCLEKKVKGIKLSFLLVQLKKNALNRKAERIELSVKLDSEKIKDKIEQKLQLRESIESVSGGVEFESVEDENQYYPPYEFMYSSPGMKL